MALNIFAEEIPSKPVTLPRFNLPPLDLETEIREAAARVAERRVIRAGVDAWRLVGKSQSFEAWATIGRALAVGKARAQRVAGEADGWRERNYIYEFGRWMRQHGFGDMPKSVRSVAVELHENIDAITAWRATLPERQRRRLVHPLSNVRRWRAATTHGARSPADLRRDAIAGWRKFLACMAQLPAHEAAPLWRMVTNKVVADVAA